MEGGEESMKRFYLYIFFKKNYLFYPYDVNIYIYIYIFKIVNLYDYYLISKTSKQKGGISIPLLSTSF